MRKRIKKLDGEIFLSLGKSEGRERRIRACKEETGRTVAA